MCSPRLARSLFAALLAVAWSVAVVGTADANKCSAGKAKCVVKKTKALLGCHAKAAGKGLAVDPTCIQKAQSKFDGGATPEKGCFEKLEAKGEKPGAKPDLVCPTSDDTAALEAKIDAFVDDLVAEVVLTLDANKCAAGKTKCAATKAGALLGCHAKGLGKNVAVDPACIQKAKSKFDGGVKPEKGCFEKLEAKGEKPGAKPNLVCPTSDDTAAIEAKIDAFVDDVVCELEPASCLDATPTPTATPALTATPTVTITPTPSANCGNGVLDSGEVCDPAAGGADGQCPNVNDTLFPCTNLCTCDCPTKVTFSGDPSAPETILDTGWNGIAHRAPVISDGDVTVSLACAASGRPCGVCNVSGPIPNTGSDELRNQRCTGNPSIQCTNAPGGTGGPCAGNGTCEFYFGAPLPLVAGGVGTCVLNQFNGSVSGTANVESGEAATSVNLISRVYSAIATDNPCPRCIGDATRNDGMQGGTCSGGTRDTLACDGNGSVPNRNDFGVTSFDCPPDLGGIIATLPIDLTNSTQTVSKEITANSPTCSGDTMKKCACDTCNSAAAEPCDSNADCPMSGGNPGICGGRRCLGGTNDGGPCGGAGGGASACPGGGTCGRPGEPTKPNACVDNTTTPMIDGTICVDTAPMGDNEGECPEGPPTGVCSLASGHAQRSCTSNNDCCNDPPLCNTDPPVLGDCEISNRKCFLDNGLGGSIDADGAADPPVNDTSSPTLAAVFCIAPTSAPAVNAAAGLPGPGKVTIKGDAAGLP